MKTAVLGNGRADLWLIGMAAHLERQETMSIRIISKSLLVVAFAGWVAFWFWAFSFAYSSSFFRYHLPTRLFFLILSLAAVIAPPLSTFVQFRRILKERVSHLRAIIVNLVVTFTPLAVLWLVYHLLKFVIEPMIGSVLIEADEAMGIGINFLLCAGVFATFNVLFAISVVARYLVRRRRAAVS